MSKPVWAVAGLALLGAAGAAAFYVAGTGGEEEIVQQQATATAPSAGATAQSTPDETAGSSATPLPGGQAPDECTSAEKAYVDPDARFAFCYPTDMSLSTDTGPRSNVHGMAVSVFYQLENYADPMYAGVVWQSTQSSFDGKPCSSGEYDSRNEKVEPFVISGLTGEACFQDRYRPDAPDGLWRKNTRVEMPVAADGGAAGGYVIVDVTYTPGSERGGQPAETIVRRFFDSVTIY
jgi:hypothetical protein